MVMYCGLVGSVARISGFRLFNADLRVGPLANHWVWLAICLVAVANLMNSSACALFFTPFGMVNIFTSTNWRSQMILKGCFSTSIAS
ncbi:hypothetical protein D9M68_839330 [compost metagenome]